MFETETTTAASEADHNALRAKKLFLNLAFFSNLALFFVLIKVIPTFADVFKSFGAQLPWWTSFVIQISFWFQWLNNPGGFAGAAGLSFLVVLPFWKWKGFGPVGAFFLFLVPLLFLVFSVAAMFTPMFELGKTVK